MQPNPKLSPGRCQSPTALWGSREAEISPALPTPNMSLAPALLPQEYWAPHKLTELSQCQVAGGMVPGQQVGTIVPSTPLVGYLCTGPQSPGSRDSDKQAWGQSPSWENGEPRHDAGLLKWSLCPPWERWSHRGKPAQFISRGCSTGGIEISVPCRVDSSRCKWQLETFPSLTVNMAHSQAGPQPSPAVEKRSWPPAPSRY